MGTCRQAAARLGCLGGRPRSHQRHGPHRRGPIHGPRLHRPHCGEQVFGIALVSDFFLLVTGVAGSCFYCKQRGAFAAADERAKGTVHFSDNDKKFGKKGRGRKGKGRAREIQLTNMRNAL